MRSGGRSKDDARDAARARLSLGGGARKQRAPSSRLGHSAQSRFVLLSKGIAGPMSSAERSTKKLSSSRGTSSRQRGTTFAKPELTPRTNTLVLSDDYTSPPTTTTSPHPERRHRSAGRRPSPGGEGWFLGADERRAGEDADGRDGKARPGRPRRDEGRHGQEDGAQIRHVGEAAFRNGAGAELAHA